MAPFSEVLINRLNELERSFKVLAQRLPEAGERLASVGRPLPEELVRELAKSAEQFEGVKREVLEVSGSVAGVPQVPEPGSIQELRSFMASVSEAIEKQAAYRGVQQAACGVLEKVLTIRHVDGLEFAPLLQCQEKARELRDRMGASAWPNIHPDAEALAGGQHVWAELVKLVSSHDQLEDEEWERLRELVNQGLGKPLGLAASRGKLILPTSSAPQPESPLAVAPPAAATEAQAESGPTEKGAAVGEVVTAPEDCEASAGLDPEPDAPSGPSAAAPTDPPQNPPAPESPSHVAAATTFEGTLDDIRYMLVLDLIDSKGMAKVLSSKIIAASNAAAGGDKKTAETFLKAFIHEVNTQTGEHISGAAPQLLLTDANILLGQLQ